MYFTIFRLLQSIDAPMSLRKFPSGACVLQLNSQRDEEVARNTSQLVSYKLLKVHNQ